jgi:hypothetical protein
VVQYKLPFLQKKENKYKAKKTVMDGITFDSKHEAERYCELKFLLRAKKISNLCLQERIEIVPKSKHGQALYYVADFVYEENGKTVVEDAKGVRTDVYRLKKRLVAERYGIIIKEV